MSNFPINKGFEQFGQIVDDILNVKKTNKTESLDKLYQTPPIKASKEVTEVALTTTVPTPIPVATTKPIIKLLVKSKRNVTNKYKNLIKKVFNI